MSTNRLFTPGPLSTSPTVKSAMLTDLGSRDEAFIARVAEVRRRVEAYRAFQRRRRRLRSAMRRIMEIVTQIREAHMEDFP